MENMGKKKPGPRRSCTPEFKAEIVELCRRGDRSVVQIAKGFDLTQTAVRLWVSRAEVDAGERDGLTSSEREELAALRRENRRLREDVEVLKRATAFFANPPRSCRAPPYLPRRSAMTRPHVRCPSDTCVRPWAGTAGTVTAPPSPKKRSWPTRPRTVRAGGDRARPGHTRPALPLGHRRRPAADSPTAAPVGHTAARHPANPITAARTKADPPNACTHRRCRDTPKRLSSPPVNRFCGECVRP